MIKRHLKEVTTDNFVIEMNMPTEYPAIDSPITEEGGVRDRFFKSVAELPDEITVVRPFNVDGFPESNKNTLYVAENGCDCHDGTKASPLATVHAALERLKGKNGGKIVLRGGDYNITEPILVTDEHSGTTSSPLIITAEKGEIPKVSASTKIPHDAFGPITDEKMLARLKPEVRDKVLVCDLPSVGITDFGVVKSGGAVLLLNSAPQTLSRYPNDGEDLIVISKDIYCQGWSHELQADIGPWEIGITDNKCLEWEWNDDIHLFGALAYEWTRLYAKIAKFDREKMSIVGAHRFDKQEIHYDPLNTYFFVNIFEELDVPGEWYIDRTTGKMYFYPPHELTACDDIRFATKPVDIFVCRKAENVIINGINAGRNCGSSFKIMDCRQALVQRCVSSGTSDGSPHGGEAVEIFGGFRSGIIDSLVEYFSNRAMSVSGGDRFNLIPCNNFIQNCKLINPLNRFGIGAGGVGNVVSHNYCHNTTMGDAGHNEGIFEYNVVEGGDTETHDTGIIYVGGGGCSSCGNHYRYNYFFDFAVGDYGIYFDDLSRGMYAYGNIIVGNGTDPEDQTLWHGGGRSFNHHNGREHCYWNNISIDAGYFAFGGDISYWNSDAMWNGLYPGILGAARHMSQSEKYMNRYPTYKDYCKAVFQYEEDRKAPGYEVKSGKAERSLRSNYCNHYENNLILRAARPFKLDVGLETATGLETNYITSEDVGFVDEANRDYRLREDSVVFEKIPGFIAPPYDKMGPVDDFE